MNKNYVTHTSIILGTFHMQMYNKHTRTIYMGVHDLNDKKCIPFCMERDAFEHLKKNPNAITVRLYSHHTTDTKDFYYNGHGYSSNNYVFKYYSKELNVTLLISESFDVKYSSHNNNIQHDWGIAYISHDPSYGYDVSMDNTLISYDYDKLDALIRDQNN